MRRVSTCQINCITIVLLRRTIRPRGSVCWNWVKLLTWKLGQFFAWEAQLAFIAKIHIHRFNKCQRPIISQWILHVLTIVRCWSTVEVQHINRENTLTKPNPGTCSCHSRIEAETVNDVIRFSSSSMWEHTGVVGNAAWLACRIKTSFLWKGSWRQGQWCGILVNSVVKFWKCVTNF